MNINILHFSLLRQACSSCASG